MTSSFFISTRQKPTNTSWTTFAKNQGNCPIEFDTYLFQNPSNVTDPLGWKLCVKKEKECEEKKCKQGWKTNRPGIYNDKDINGWYRNTIPYQNRRQLYSPRSELDRYDYFQLPTRYAGTGYEVLRSWKRPQYAEDMVDVPPVWDKTRLAQPYPIQQQSYKAQKDEWSTLTTIADTGIPGAFYGQPTTIPKQNSRK